jgi:hypothetical protein
MFGTAAAAAQRAGNASSISRALLRAVVSGDGGGDGGGASQAPVAAPAAAGSSSTVSVRQAWRAINAYEQATAVGNPAGVALDPPDQGLAVGGPRPFAVASVNRALRVYEAKTGAPLSPPVDLSVLFALPPYLGQPNLPQGCGDRLTDPTTLYDPELRRWFQVMLRVETNQQTCLPTGGSTLEVAVSKTADPLKAWNVYSIYSSNNGQNGSPLVPGCQDGCLADFPRAQLDPNVLVIAVNAFSDGGLTFVGAGVYVLNKFALAKGAAEVALAEFVMDTAGEWDGNQPLFTLSPAYVPPRKLPASSAPSSRYGGGRKHNHRHHDDHKKQKKKPDGPPAYKAPFLLLSRSLDDVQRLIRFALTGTRAVKAATTPAGLEALSTALTITASPVELPDPPAATIPSPLLALQPITGNIPLGESKGYFVPGYLGGSDFRMASSALANGRHYGVFSAFAKQVLNGEPVSYFSVYLAQLNATTGELLKAELLSAAHEDLTWPSIAVDRRGRGAVVCTASSEDPATGYASVAFFPLAPDGTAGPRQIALQGLGLEDGFTQYPPLPGRPARPRAGDYSAAVVIDAASGDLFGAAEYVSVMSCTYAEWLVDSTCGGTRSKGTNWDTGVFQLRF